MSNSQTHDGPIFTNKDENNITNITSIKLDEITVSKESVVDFLSFLDKKEDFLDTGLGAFHHNAHGNW